MSSKLREALSEVSIALSWATHGHLTEDDAKEYLAIVDAALALPKRNCDAFPDNKLVDEFCKYMNYDMMDPKNGFADGLNEFMREYWFAFSLWITQDYEEKKNEQ